MGDAAGAPHQQGAGSVQVAQACSVNTLTPVCSFFA